MATYSQLVDRVIADLARADTSITDTVKLHILDAIEHHSTERFWFNETHGALTTSSSLGTYAVPTDFLELDSAVVTVNGQRTPLRPIGFQELNEMDTGLVFGAPLYITHYDEQFRLYPVPNKTFTVSLSYQNYIPTLSATGDSNAWTTVALELIRARAEKTLYGFRYHDQTSAQMMQAAEDMALEGLRSRTERGTSTGKLRSSW